MESAQQAQNLIKPIGISANKIQLNTENPRAFNHINCNCSLCVQKGLIKLDSPRDENLVDINQEALERRKYLHKHILTNEQDRDYFFILRR